MTRPSGAARWRPRRAGALLALLFCAPALGQPGDEGSSRGAGALERVVKSVEDVSARARRAVDAWLDVKRPAPPPVGVFVAGQRDGRVAWTPIAVGERPGSRVVLLVHGLDEPGGIWDDLAAALLEDPVLAGRCALAQFQYPNDQRIASSADLLAGALRDLKARGVERVDLVCHSMGGLLARDVLTRPGYYDGNARGGGGLPAVERLILIGTPNAGSPWAKLRALAEIREQVARFLDAPDHDARRLLGYLSDGLGEAGDDLLPGSPFLAELNGRPAPTGVVITVIVGRLAPVRSDDLAWLSESWLVRQLLGGEDAAAVSAGIAELSSELGDGVVPVSSALLPGVSDVVSLEANHRSMLKRVTLVCRPPGAVAPAHRPPAIGVILDRLGRSGPADP